MRIKLLITAAVVGTCVVGTQQAHAGCTTALKDKVAAHPGSQVVQDAAAYERCVV